ncbi:MAG TPA: serine hydrolase [Candidatus Paceibacterota bacterium]|nr:serine hydrolase [Candidatus Paceibacterota bacterium]
MKRGSFPEASKHSIAKHPVLSAALAAIVIALCTFNVGWAERGYADKASISHALRLSGYQFVNPLLVCNISNPSPVLEDKSLETTLQRIVDTHRSAGDISKASVYLTDPTSGKWATIYSNDTFYPSSLGKIPIMIAYYLESESDPSILDKEITFPVGSADLNVMQDIPPEQAIVQGYTYTIEQLIEYMIKYSDNNATELLDSEIDHSTLNKVYGDLGIPTNDNPNLQNLDFLTTHQIATLFRVLYNATYLSRADSEKALELLSQSSFTQGIVAGVASSTVVSHKLGLVGIAPDNVTTEHELHDCGIVYGKDAYVLCVMTRGSAPLPTLENIIAQISAATYKDVQSTK